MRVVWTTWLVLSLALAAGCNREALHLPPAAPLAAPGGEYPALGEAVGGEVNPVRVEPIPSARPSAQAEPPAVPPGRQVAPAAPAGPVRVQTSDETTAEPRPENATIPPSPERPPVLTMIETPAGQTAHLVDTVLAEVNGEVITREDILGPLRPQMEQWRKEHSTEAFESRCRAAVDLKLRQAISERLVLQEARNGLSDTEKEQIEADVAQTVTEMTARATSALQLEEALKKDGTSLDEEKNKLRDRLMVQRYLHEKIAPIVHTTYSELLEYYNQVRDERYVQPTEMRLRLITIKKSESPTPDQARALAEAVFERAKAGENFATLATRYSHDAMASQGGDWGRMKNGSFRVKAVDKVLFALAAGQVGPLVETDDAFYILKADERLEGRTVPLSEVQSTIEDEVRDRKFNQTVSDYVQKLYERAYVRILTDNL